MYDEADLPPEGTVKTFGEVRQNLHEEISGERDVVDGFKRRTWGGDRGGPIRPLHPVWGTGTIDIAGDEGCGIEIDL